MSVLATQMTGSKYLNRQSAFVSLYFLGPRKARFAFDEY